MSDNHDSIFAGLQACNPRDLCAALSSWQHGESADFDMFVRAVTSLALTVDEQRTELARLNASLAAVARVAEQQQYATNPLGLIDRFDRHNAAHIVADPTLRYATPEGQLELVYLGLVEVYRMAAQREQYERESREGAYFGALVAIEARCRAMLEAAGKLPPY